jgi:hypothetical protein
MGFTAPVPNLKCRPALKGSWRSPLTWTLALRGAPTRPPAGLAANPA